MDIIIKRIRLGHGPKDPYHGQQIGTFDASVGGVFSIRRGVIKQMPDGSFRIGLRAGGREGRSEGISMSDGPVKDRLTSAVVNAYLAEVGAAN